MRIYVVEVVGEGINYFKSQRYAKEYLEYIGFTLVSAMSVNENQKACYRKVYETSVEYAYLSWADTVD